MDLSHLSNMNRDELEGRRMDLLQILMPPVQLQPGQHISEIEDEIQEIDNQLKKFD